MCRSLDTGVCFSSVVRTCTHPVTSNNWRVFNVELPDGSVEVNGILSASSGPRKSSDHFINQLKWPSLHLRQNYFTIKFCQVHRILNHQSALPSSQFFSTVNRHPSNPLALDTSKSTIGPYRYSFFISSPFLWNNIPAKILQITDMTLFCVAL